MGILARLGSETKAVMDAIKSRSFSSYGGAYGVNGGYGGMLPGYGMDTLSYHLPGSKYDDRAAAGVLWENPAAAACFVALTKAFAQARPILQKRKTRDGNDWQNVDHELIARLNKPNDFYSGERMFGVTLISAMSQGAAFWRFERDRKGDVSEIWYEPPAGIGATGIAPNWDKNTFIKDYYYFVDGKRDPEPLDKEDVVYFRHGLNVANPRMPWAPLGLGAREIATLNSASTYTASILRNHAAPLGFVSLEGGDNVTFTPPTPEQAEELKAQIERKFGGPENAGKTFVGSLPWRWNKVGLSPAELVIDKIRQWPQETICALLGTPVIVALLPTGEQPTYQNLDASMRWWWDNTIIPLEASFGDEIETQMFPAFGLDPAEYRIEWDRANVPALREDESAKHEMIREDYKAGIIDLYKATEMQGEVPDESMRGKLHPDAVPKTIEEAQQAAEAGQQAVQVPPGTEEDETDEEETKAYNPNQPRDADGRWGSVGTSVSLKASKDRAFSGSQIETNETLTKSETGKLGEAIMAAWLLQKGAKDVKTRVDRNNYPIDLVEHKLNGDVTAIECKTGLVSNGSSAQRWRLTIGEPGKAEKADLAKMTPEQKQIYNRIKMQKIQDRKLLAVGEIAQETGQNVKLKTLAVIINPDTKTADIHVFDGIHEAIYWNSDQMKNGYQESVKYEQK